MTIENEQVEGLMFLGYTAREAAFLCLVALHSGYSIRRQYCRFLGLTSGRPDDLLVRKILARKHAREHPTCGRTRLYHLCARPFYSAIGQPHNRHRRTRPAFAVKAKLMALDYVLTHLNHRFLATEEEKIDYFRRERGIPPAMLPVKRYRSRWTAAVTERYFVDKFPVYLCEGDSFSPPMACFCYIDEGVISTPGFDTYVAQYSRLFESLGPFAVVFVSSRMNLSRSATRLFDRMFPPPARRRPAHYRSLREQLLGRLRLEDLLREEQYSQLTTAKLGEVRALRKLLGGERYEALSEAWKSEGEAAVLRLCDADRPALTPPRPEFRFHAMNESYDFL